MNSKPYEHMTRNMDPAMTEDKFTKQEMVSGSSPIIFVAFLAELAPSLKDKE
jgi:hypothetical protein